METREENHPLMAWQPSCIESMRQWFDEWERAKLAERKRELLFVGFEVETESTEMRINRIKHYLAVADDHTGSAWTFHVAPGDDEEHVKRTAFGRKKMHELRIIIAQKAFEMICLNFFKNKSQSSDDRPSWTFLMSQEEVLKSVLYFFRLEKNNPRNFVNLHLSSFEKSDHFTLIAVDFLRRFIISAWPANESDARVSAWWDADALDMFRRYYPKFVDILHGLGQSQLLFERHANIDKASLTRLKELALGRPMHRTIEEAIFSGSQAARTFLLLEVIKKEGKRREEFQQAKRVADKANRKLEQLST